MNNDEQFAVKIQHLRATVEQVKDQMAGVVLHCFKVSKEMRERGQEPGNMAVNITNVIMKEVFKIES